MYILYKSYVRTYTVHIQYTYDVRYIHASDQSNIGLGVTISINFMGLWAKK